MSENLQRREFLKKVGKGLAFVTLSSAIPVSCKPKKQPNILFIMSDDHAYQAISAYGGKLNKTPNIDRIAEEGVRFEQSFVTNSICAPSRAVLLTGKYSHLNGVINNSGIFDGSQQTFPKLLREHGYQTAMIGKWHLKSQPTGFDYWNVLPGQGHYYNPDFIEMGEKKRVNGYVTDLITDFALDWLENKRDKNKPFCLLLHHKAPHRNWMPDTKYLHKYDDVKMPLPETFFDDYSTRSRAAKEQEMEIARHLFIDFDLKVTRTPDEYPANDWEKMGADMWKNAYNRMTEEQRKAWDAAYEPKNALFRKARLKGKDLAVWKYERYIKDYLRCIDSVDENVGRILKYLDNSGLAENTVVVYTSDQGFYLGEHGWFDKRWIYEQSLRMPLLVRYPREALSGAVNKDDMVLNLDFAPTFLDYANVEIPSDMQGRSFRGVLKGKTPSDWRQAVYYHYYEYPGWHKVKRHYGIRTKRYKLVHFYYDIDAWELYDLENDPNEIHNVYDEPAYQAVVKKLKSQLKRLQQKYGDTNFKKYLPVNQRKTEHLGVGKRVLLVYQPAKRYKGNGINALCDGMIYPDGKYSDINLKEGWLGFNGVDLIATIDLGKIREIQSVRAQFLQQIESWIFMPTQVTFMISKDGKKYVPVAAFENPLSERQTESVCKTLKAEGIQKKARFIKVHAKNRGVCPDWHPGAGEKAWLFCDEIIVQ